MQNPKKSTAISAWTNGRQWAEQAGTSKRGSILQLCEEIAGEIESDTVEVKRIFTNGKCKGGEAYRNKLEEAETER